ncbi:MAG: hypothetical protein J6Q06_00630, partial [Clostridia bacterium]|nr:hypothetical protein [Clostridia bacterium]
FFYAVVDGLGLCPVPQARTGFPPLTLANEQVHMLCYYARPSRYKSGTAPKRQAKCLSFFMLL